MKRSYRMHGSIGNAYKILVGISKKRPLSTDADSI